jgi:lysophospholipase L1-like esterase
MTAISLTPRQRLLAVAQHQSADLLPDGVHPNADGMRKIAEAWFLSIPRSWIFVTKLATKLAPP